MMKKLFNQPDTAIKTKMNTLTNKDVATLKEDEKPNASQTPTFRWGEKTLR